MNFVEIKNILVLTLNMFLLAKNCIPAEKSDFYFRDAIGKFPEYPTEEEGGSLRIFQPKDPLEVILETSCHPRRSDWS